MAPNWESIRWSPDSRYLAFTENFFRRFTEPDIWVLDTTTWNVTDITDDGGSTSTTSRIPMEKYRHSATLAAGRADRLSAL